jgi:hypothetical protein
MQLVKKMIAGLGVLAGLALTGQAQALTCDATSCKGTIKSIVQYYSTETAAQTQVRLDADVAPTGCTLNAGKYWVVRVADENIHKVVVAAYLAGKTISFRKIDGPTTCTAMYVVVE